MDICKDLVHSDRFPKASGAVWENGGWTRRCGLHGKGKDHTGWFIHVIYITTGLTMAISTYKNFVHYFCIEENDLYIKFTYSACWCINFLLLFSFLNLFLNLFLLFGLCWNVASQAV